MCRSWGTPMATPTDALAAYAYVWAFQQVEQTLLSGLGYAAKGRPLLALAYVVNVVLSVRAATFVDCRFEPIVWTGAMQLPRTLPDYQRMGFSDSF